MKALWLLLLLPTVQAAEPGDAALAYLLDEDASGPYMVEALNAARIDAASWPTPGDDVLSRMAIPENDGTPNPDGLLRRLHAAVGTGIDPRAYPDPVRGTIDLRAQLADQAEHVLDGHDAHLAFQILAMVAAGMTPGDALIDRLLAWEDDGAWSCGGAARGIDCTGFALVALAAVDRIDAVQERAGAFVKAALRDDGGFGVDTCPHGNTQSTAWGIHALQALGEPVPAATWDALHGNQMPDGGFCFGGRSNVLATAEAVVVLHDGLPQDPDAPRHGFEAQPFESASPGRDVPVSMLVMILGLLVALVALRR